MSIITTKDGTRLFYKDWDKGQPVVRLRASGEQLPIIFMTGHGDFAMGVQAMRTGAINFLTKPFRDQDILDAVSEAIKQDRSRREAFAVRRETEARLAKLTSRELQIMEAVATGALNKQIAADLGISEAARLARGLDFMVSF